MLLHLCLALFAGEDLAGMADGGSMAGVLFPGSG